MFEVKFKTLHKDGREVETVASAQHFVAFEEHFDEPVPAALGVGKLTSVYYLAWLSSSSGQEFKEWVSTVRDVDIVGSFEITPFGPAMTDISLPS